MNTYTPSLMSEQMTARLVRICEHFTPDEVKNLESDLCNKCATQLDEDGQHWTPDQLCKPCLKKFKNHIFADLYALARALGEEGHAEE